MGANHCIRVTKKNSLRLQNLKLTYKVKTYNEVFEILLNNEYLNTKFKY